MFEVNSTETSKRLRCYGNFNVFLPVFGFWSSNKVLWLSTESYTWLLPLTLLDFVWFALISSDHHISSNYNIGYTMYIFQTITKLYNVINYYVHKLF